MAGEPSITNKQEEKSKMMKKTLAVGAAAVAVSLTLAGCASGPDTQNVKTDYGVTATQIKLGSLTDVSKIYAGSAPSIVAGNKIYFDDRNKNSKICGREVVIDVQDHGSDNTKVVTLFQAMEPNILALTQLLGSPQQQAAAAAIQGAGVTSMLAGWSSTALVTPAAPNNKFYVLAGTTYPLDIINGLSYFQDSGKIKKGDQLGYINVPGGFGADAFAGGKYFADKAGYNVNQTVITGTETDLSAQVNALLAKNITALVVSAGPGSVNPAVAAVKASGKNIPILINSPGYASAVVAPNAPTAAFFQSNVFIVSGLLPTSDANTDALKKVQSAFADAVKSGAVKDTVVNDQQLNYGYAMASILGQAMDAACKAGDMTRAGLNTALGTLSKVVTGVTVDLDYTNRAKSPSTATYVIVPDANALGKSKLVKDIGTSALAADFQAGK
jgi:ABC-type branched-subunit amino acid transport system substrate-binding protein